MSEYLLFSRPLGEVSAEPGGYQHPPPTLLPLTLCSLPINATMSPHFDLLSDETTSCPQLDLEGYDVGLNGFLPSELPLTVLSDPYYTPWEDVINHLPELLKCQALRHQIDGLPVLAADRLRTIPEWRRAYVILSFLAHGYIWGGDRPSEVRQPQPTPFISPNLT